MVSFVFLRDGVTLWVKCVLHTLLIMIEGLPLAIGSCSFGLGSHAGCYCLRLVFPWLGVIVCLCATLVFPVWLLLLCRLPSLGILSLLRIVVPLASFVIFACCVLYLSLFLSCSSLRSFGGPLVPSWPSVISLSFAPLWVLAREVLFLMCLVSAPSVWGFWVVSLVFSFRAPLLPFLPSRGLLRWWGSMYALCLAPFC